MLIRFTSKIAPEVVMLPVHAQPLLLAAGKQFKVLPEQGVFTAAQLPAAIAGIETAARLEPVPTAPDDDNPRPHPLGEHVSLQRRAFPLLDMMRKSLDAGEGVMWALS